MMQLPPAGVSDEMLTRLRSFKEHVRDFPAKGPSGIGYMRAKVIVGAVTDATTQEVLPIRFRATIDCLTYRNHKGSVVGILHYYPEAIALEDMLLEEKGSVNIFVRPDRQRRGIGTALLREAMQRWPIDWSQQRYTKAGRALVERALNDDQDHDV